MSTGPYGRQWIQPKASSAFNNDLIAADNYCISGNTKKAIRLYKRQSGVNHIAGRRLRLIQKQIKKSLLLENNKNEVTKVHLGFIDWYPGFDDHADDILDLFKNAGVNAKRSAPEEADILIAGSYGNRLIVDTELNKDKLVLLITGENICPSYDIHDFSLSTRTRTFCGKNIRYPQWMSELRIKNEKIMFRNHSSYIFDKNRTRDLMVSAIYNNATPEREEALYVLRQAFGEENIHVFGSQRTGEINKVEILARSQINLCFENSLGEGYVTEKLLHALIMGCKALYWGDSQYSKDFNEKDVLNIRDNYSTDSIVNWCRRELSERRFPPQQIKEIGHELFASKPTYDHIYRKISEWSGLILAWRH